MDLMYSKKFRKRLNIAETLEASSSLAFFPNPADLSTMARSEFFTTSACLFVNP